MKIHVRLTCSRKTNMKLSCQSARIILPKSQYLDLEVGEERSALFWLPHSTLTTDFRIMFLHHKSAFAKIQKLWKLVQNILLKWFYKKKLFFFSGKFHKLTNFTQSIVSPPLSHQLAWEQEDAKRFDKWELDNIQIVWWHPLMPHFQKTRIPRWVRKFQRFDNLWLSLISWAFP